MSNEQNLAVVRAAFDAFNAGDLDRAAALVSDDFRMEMVPLGMHFHGPDGFREYLRSWRTAFPDAVSEIVSVTAGDGRVAIEHVGRGTHLGPLGGGDREVPASGKRVEIRFFDVMEVRAGRIVRARNYFDAATLLRQVGAMPGEEAAVPA